MASHQPQLSLGIHEDDMEISSDAGRQGADDDILIDVDIEASIQHPPDEDFMDDDEPRGTQDDIMFDEVIRETREETMEEDFEFEDHDEELQDAIEETYTEDVSHEVGEAQSEDHIVKSTQANQHHQTSEISDVTNVTGRPGQLQSNGIFDIELPEDNDETQYFEANSELVGVYDEHGTSQDTNPAQQSQHDAEGQLQSGDPRDEALEQAEAPTTKGVTLDMKSSVARTVPSGVQHHGGDGETTSSTITDPQNIATGSIIHATSDLYPVTAVWGDAEVSLFPKDSFSQYFLQDSSVAQKPLSEFLAACRSVLSEDLVDDVDLEAEFEPLDLHVCETSPDSATSSLADVLDVYVHLCLNDGIDHPDPLRVVFTAKTAFASRLSALFDALTQGQGLSSINDYESEDDVSGDGVPPPVENADDEADPTDNARVSTSDRSSHDRIETKASNHAAASHDDAESQNDVGEYNTGRDDPAREHDAALGVPGALELVKEAESVLDSALQGEGDGEQSKTDASHTEVPSARAVEESTHQTEIHPTDTTTRSTIEHPQSAGDGAFEDREGLQGDGLHDDEEYHTNTVEQDFESEGLWGQDGVDAFEDGSRNEEEQSLDKSAGDDFVDEEDETQASNDNTSAITLPVEELGDDRTSGAEHGTTDQSPESQAGSATSLGELSSQAVRKGTAKESAADQDHDVGTNEDGDDLYDGLFLDDDGAEAEGAVPTTADDTGEALVRHETTQAQVALSQSKTTPSQRVGAAVGNSQSRKRSFSEHEGENASISSDPKKARPA